MSALAGPSLMLREIAEQPAALARTLDALAPLAPQLRRLAQGRAHVAFVARGSSDNAAVYGRYLCEAHAGRSARLMAPSIATHYARRVALDDTLVVCVSQSGATEEIVSVATWARDCGAAVVAVSNAAESRLGEVADVVLHTRAGAELAVPATKTYTTQLAAMAVLGLALGSPDASLEHALERAPGELERLIDSPLEEAALAGLAAGDRVVVTGRGYTLTTALELSLKLLEACALPTVGLSSADLVHGPIAAAEPGTPALVLAPPAGPVLAGLTGVAHRLRVAGATVIGCGGDGAFAAAADVALPGPDLPEPLAPLALAVPGQLLVEALARRLGRDPDQPRGLTKVTQTEGDD